MPLRGVLGSDLVKNRPDWRVSRNEFANSEDPLLLIPALAPDVALFHARWADDAGNVWIGRRRELATIAHAAKQTFVTYEERRAGDMLEDELLAPGVLSSVYVSAAAPAKRGAWPLGVPDMYDLAGQGRIDAFFLGGAQIDGEANINLVQAEGRRFSGSFGSAFMYSAVRKVILFREEHSRRVLVPRVEFISAAGNPAALLTGKALFSWQTDKRRFRLESFHDSTPEEIRANTGSDYDVSPRPPRTPTPPQAHFLLLRHKVKTEVARDYPDFAKRVWGLD